jgi:APA family basic amino acid/polyamine antiporter
VRQNGFGFWSALFLVIANMVGTGIYTTSGFLVADLPATGGVLMLWMLGGLAALGGALAYAALAKRYPRSGGEYHFLSKLYHPALGFLAGIVSIIAGFSAPIAASAYAFSQYLPLPLSDFQRLMAAALLILLLSGLHMLGLARAARIQNVFVLVKIGLLLTLILGGLLVALLPAGAPLPTSELFYFECRSYGSDIYQLCLLRLECCRLHHERGAPGYRDRSASYSAGTLTVMVLYSAFNYVLFRHLSIDELSGKVEVGRLLAKSSGGIQATFG